MPPCDYDLFYLFSLYMPNNYAGMGVIMVPQSAISMFSFPTSKPLMMHAWLWYNNCAWRLVVISLGLTSTHNIVKNKEIKSLKNYAYFFFFFVLLFFCILLKIQELVFRLFRSILFGKQNKELPEKEKIIKHKRKDWLKVRYYL